MSENGKMQFFPKLLIGIVGCYALWKFLRPQTGSTTIAVMTNDTDKGDVSEYSDTLSSETSSDNGLWPGNPRKILPVEKDIDNLPRNAPNTTNYFKIQQIKVSPLLKFQTQNFLQIQLVLVINF